MLNPKSLLSLRGAVIALGAWLFISAFVLPHTRDQAMVAWIAGALIVANAIVWSTAEGTRYIDEAIAVLLCVAVLAVPSASVVTRVNDACVAIAVFVLSALAGGAPRLTRMLHRRHHGHER